MGIDRRTAVNGAVAGLLGVTAMGGVGLTVRRAFLDPDKPMKTHPEQVVERLSELAGRRDHLDVRTRRRLGDLIHFGFGALQGAVFAHLVRDRDVDPLVAGPAFAAGLWVAGFCGYLPALKMHEPPWRWHPLEFLITGGTHTTYGIVTALSLKALTARAACRRGRAPAGNDR